MTKDMQKIIQERKSEAAELVKYANPKSKTRKTVEEITEILSRYIPRCGDSPFITQLHILDYHKNNIIKTARFIVEVSNGKNYEITAYQDLTGRTQAEKEADKTAMFPSGLFNIFYKEITA